jgi:phosphoribosylformimino-5-aminoimidazole carboxamide ribotide isomerase
VDLFPAIDLLGGRVVQLVQGDFDSGTVHGDDPVAVALSFEAAGCPWIHCVDLDAAKTGEPLNRHHIAAIVDAVSIPVQASGGVRDDDAAAALLDIGVARVVIGTAALEDPSLVERVAARQRVALGLDVRGREVAVRGWTEGSGRDWVDVLAELSSVGAEAVVVTQIDREGLMGGPDLVGLAEVLSATTLEVVASGGVSSLDDLRALDGLSTDDGRRLAAVIVGTAIYEGAVPVPDAVEVLRCAPPA